MQDELDMDSAPRSLRSSKTYTQDKEIQIGMI